MSIVDRPGFPVCLIAPALELVALLLFLDLAHGDRLQVV